MEEPKDIDPYDFDYLASTGLAAASTTDGRVTPDNSDSTTDDNETCFDTPRSHAGPTAPWPGNTYIIRDPHSTKQITLVRGELVLREHLGNQGGYHWECIEKDGWLGFRNPTDTMHIGHDNRRKFIASAKEHRPWEYFNVRAHPKGGHILLVVHGWQQWKMVISKDGESLEETRGEGTAWEFIKVSPEGNTGCPTM